MNNLNELASAAYQNAVSKGFYDKPISFPERIALIHSELSEAVEADRKDRYVEPDHEARGSGKITHVLQYEDDETFKQWYDRAIKGTFEEEMADTGIRILDWMGYAGEDAQERVDIARDIDTTSDLWPSDAKSTSDKIGHLHAHVSMALMQMPTYRGAWLGAALNKVLVLCSELSIDIEKHIAAKMRYNSLRQHMHGGKKY